MKRVTSYLMAMLIVVAIGLAAGDAQIQEEAKPLAKTGDVTSTLPVSLDNFFPPKTEQPVYLLRMLDMGVPFTAIMVDLFENDLENVQANFERFRTQYVEVSKLVPEWEQNFPLAPVVDLGAALKTGDQGKVMGAMEQMGKVCSDCHVRNMPRVQHKYHWGNFSSITVTDPLTKQEVSFQQLMLFVDASYTGIDVDTEQGQIENARQQLQSFRARFQTLEETCMNCHDTERHYFVDESVQGMVERLGEALNAPVVDPKLVGTLTQNIGMESCFKCHLVHVPAAAAQLQMAR